MTDKKTDERKPAPAPAPVPTPQDDRPGINMPDNTTEATWAERQPEDDGKRDA